MQIMQVMLESQINIEILLFTQQELIPSTFSKDQCPTATGSLLLQLWPNTQAESKTSSLTNNTQMKASLLLTSTSEEDPSLSPLMISYLTTTTTSCSIEDQMMVLSGEFS